MQVRHKVQCRQAHKELLYDLVVLTDFGRIMCRVVRHDQDTRARE